MDLTIHPQGSLWARGIHREKGERALVTVRGTVTQRASQSVTQCGLEGRGMWPSEDANTGKLCGESLF